MVFICYPKCSTCKKAQKWLDENGISYEVRDIKEQNPSAVEIKNWHKKSTLELKRFFNTSGKIYREKALKDKLPHMNDEEKYKLLASDGMLVKRPILLADTFVLVGFKETEWKEHLL